MAARPYQLELYRQSLDRNSIVYLDTGAGKTLVSILLLQHFLLPHDPISSQLLQNYRHQLHLFNASASISDGGHAKWMEEMRANWPKVGRKVVFLVPTVPLVEQQARVIAFHSDATVGQFLSSDTDITTTTTTTTTTHNASTSSSSIYTTKMSFDFFEFQYAFSQCQVWVLTPQTLLNALRHGLLKMDMHISLLIFDECHHCAKMHPYARIMSEFYHTLPTSSSHPSASTTSTPPRVFGMTASPILSKVSTKQMSVEKLMELQRLLDATIITLRRGHALAMEGYVSRAREEILEYDPTPPSSHLPIFADTIIHSQSTAWVYYTYQISLLITFHNASLSLNTLQKFQKMVRLVGEMLSELGPWCAGRIAETYVRAVWSGLQRKGDRVFLKRSYSGDHQRGDDDDKEEEGLNGMPTEDGSEKGNVQFEWKPMTVPELRKFDESTLPRIGLNQDRKAFGSLDLDSARVPDERKVMNVPPAPTVAELVVSDLTHKLRNLMRVLVEFHRKHYHHHTDGSVHQQQGEKLRTLIFVSKRASAKALSEFLNELSPLLFDDRLRAGYITGHGGSNNGSKVSMEMSTQAQRKTLSDFRTGRLNLMVVTSVAEEGLDVPACNLVIVFDLFATSTSYVQSRGRARNKNSTYVIMTPRGSKASLQQIAEAKLGEGMIRETCRALSEQGSIRVCDVAVAGDDGDGMEDGEVVSNEDVVDSLVGGMDGDLVVDQTGARASLVNAMDVLNRYCFSLPRDKYTSSNTNAPVYECIKQQEEWGIAYSVKLPVSCPLGVDGKVVRGGVRVTRKLAMQSVALEACKKLYEAGCLNKHLLINNAASVSSSLVTASTDGTDGGNNTRPKKKARVEDEVTRVHFIDRVVPRWFKFDHEWERILGGTNKSVQLETVLKHAYRAHVDDLYPEPHVAGLYLSAIEVEGEAAFGILTRLELPSIDPFEIYVGKERRACSIKVVTLGQVKLNAEQTRLARGFQLKLFSFILQKRSGQAQAGEEGEVESSLENLATDESVKRMFKLIPLHSQRGIDWMRAKQIVDYDVQSQPLLHDNNIGDIEHRLLVTPHNLMKYIGLGVSTKKATDPMSEDSETTFEDYFREKHSVTLKYPELNLLEAEHMPRLQNLLSSRMKARLEDERVKLYLPVELCFAAPLSIGNYDALAQLPSVLSKLEMQLVVHEFLLSFNVVQGISVSQLFPAFCAANANQPVNYERLETLGDSLLKYLTSSNLYNKYPHLDEGGLSSHRAHIVNNKRLAQLASKFDLGSFLIASPFYARSWTLPEITGSRSNRKDMPKDASADTQLVSMKMMADFTESLLGAFYVGAGIDGAKWFAERFEVVDTEIRLIDRTVPTEVYQTHPLELGLKYEFTDKRLLMEALTHASYTSATTQSYQRLEFLGDAALDWLITRHLFQKFSAATSMHMTEMRQATVNNNSFGRLAVQLGLHENLLHPSDVLRQDVNQFVGWYHRGDNKNMSPNEITLDAPKVLGDVFESLCGAILVDTGYDLERLWDVISPYITEFVERHCDPEQLRRNPVRLLYEAAQARGYQPNEIDLRVSPHVDGFNCSIYLRTRLLCECTGNTDTTAKRLACIKGLELV